MDLLSDGILYNNLYNNRYYVYVVCSYSSWCSQLREVTFIQVSCQESPVIKIGLMSVVGPEEEIPEPSMFDLYTQ